MEFKAILSPGAESDYLRAPEEHKPIIATRLGEPLGSPSKYRRPAPVPKYEPGYLVYEFTLADKLGRFEYAILFKYKDDNRLWIYAIARRHLDFAAP